MDPQIANQQLVIQARQYIYDNIKDVGKSGYFINGVNTTALNDIYHQLDPSNVNELYPQAQDIISTHLRQARGEFNRGQFYFGCQLGLVGLGISGITYIVDRITNEQYKDYTKYVYQMGSALTMAGFCWIFAIGH